MILCHSGRQNVVVERGFLAPIGKFCPWLKRVSRIYCAQTYSMTLRVMQNKYTFPLIALHWLTVFLLLLAYGSILISDYAQPGTWHGYAIAVTHVTAGATVLITMIMRLMIRLRKRSPAIIPAPKRWHTALSHLTHTCIYALFISLPALALTSHYFWGGEWSLYGLPMPVAAVPDTELSETLIHWHAVLAPLGYWLIGLHALAALVHHYIFRDNTLIRMMPSRQKG